MNIGCPVILNFNNYIKNGFFFTMDMEPKELCQQNHPFARLHMIDHDEQDGGKEVD